MAAYKVLIWGTGEKTEAAVANGCLDDCEIIGFVDTYKKEPFFRGYPVFYPEEVPKMMEKVNYLILMNSYFLENIDLCLKLGIQWGKLAICCNVEAPFFREMFLRVRNISEALYAQEANRQMQLVKTNESDHADPDRLLGRGRFRDYHLYGEDYFRYRTFEFTARELIRNHVPGAAAELGVFRGTFAAMINEIFHDRKLYLFDTFEGFSQEEAQKEISLGRCDEFFVSAHMNSSVKQLLEKLPHPDQCSVCKGLFPECVTEEAMKEKYAFVSLDVDFEESSYQGLKFFYPRLSKGGIIFLHDYTTDYLEGVRRAVERFEEDCGIQLKKVPLADRAGTLVIVK